MGRQKTTEEFIQQAKKVHGNKYDYRATTYVKSSEKVKIICPNHGEFEQTPSDHLSGRRCMQCYLDNKSKERTWTTAEFIHKAVRVHDCFYSYEDANYINHKKHINITCPIHGNFSQMPYAHISGQGCPLCANMRRGAGYKNEPTILYCLYFSDFNIWKIGITAERVGIALRYKNNTIKYTILKEILFPTGKEAVKYEKRILSAFKGYQYTGEPILATGNTELLTIDPSGAEIFNLKVNNEE